MQQLSGWYLVIRILHYRYASVRYRRDSLYRLTLIDIRTFLVKSLSQLFVWMSLDTESFADGKDFKQKWKISSKSLDNSRAKEFWVRGNVFNQVFTRACES